MIQLASDPNASRPQWRPAQEESESKAAALATTRRTGHAWPFISSYELKPAGTQPAKPASQHGS